MKKILAVCAAAFLAGCITHPVYQLDLMPRGQGEMAYGTAKQIDKSVSIELGGETFVGKYVFVQGGAFSLADGVAGGTNVSSTAYTFSATGNGNILARAPGGHNLRCVFRASSLSRSGTGECVTDDGKVYDLQLSR